MPSLVVSDEFRNKPISKSILVCYGRLEPALINGYDLLIIEATYYSIYEVNRLKAQNGKVIAYISLGEINSSSPYFPKFKDYFIGKNETWNSHYLNLKSKEVGEILLDMISAIMSKGFDGLFFDNVDNFSSYGPQFQQKQELINLLKEINTKYPKHFFIQNSGIELVPSTAEFIDALVMESVITNYTFDSSGYKLRAVDHADVTLNKLEVLKKKYRLPIILIEYSDSTNLNDAIQSKMRTYNFDYFIGNISLLTIPQFLN
jgi:hypothetical protein